MSQKVKRLAGQFLLEVCDRLPALKRPLGKWGMRTDQDWFPGRVVRVQLPGGKSIALGSFSQNYLSFEVFWKGVRYYEPITTLIARELTREAVTFLDVGANIGFYTLVLSALNPSLKVVAFEPNPKNLSLLRGNVALNAFDLATCEPLALSDDEGSTELYLSASDMSASLESGFEKSNRCVTVSRTSLDHYLSRRDLADPLVIKVDVEGHEAAFFRGAQHTIETRKPDIICEVTAAQDRLTRSFLKDSGYRFYQITEAGLLPSEHLRLVVRNGLVFLNYLLSARPPAEISRLFDRVADQVGKLDLTRSSKRVSAELLAGMLARERTAGTSLAA
jgi:FkbM family methyltransferase